MEDEIDDVCGLDDVYGLVNGDVLSAHEFVSKSESVCAKGTVVPLANDQSPHTMVAQASGIQGVCIHDQCQVETSYNRVVEHNTDVTGKTMVGSTIPVEQCLNTGAPEFLPDGRYLATGASNKRLIIVGSDGGCRMTDGVGAAGYVVYGHDWNVLGGATNFSEGVTSQDCEFEAAWLGLDYAVTNFPSSNILLITDSILVEKSLQGVYNVTKPRHRVLVSKIRRLQRKNRCLICTVQVPRRFNAGADRMCNWSMDRCSSISIGALVSEEQESLFSDGQITSGIVDTIVLRTVDWDLCDQELTRYHFGLVLNELILRTTFIPFNPLCVAEPPCVDNYSVDTGAGEVPTGFETNTCKDEVNGLPRIVSAAAFSRIRDMCIEFDITWDDNAFLADRNTDELPFEDIRILSQLAKHLHYDVAKVIELFRDQSPDDMRPNKHLHPERYREHLRGYPDLSTICQIAEQGFNPRVENFIPKRPLATNYQSAEVRAPAMLKRFNQEYVAGRTLLIDEHAAQLDPRVNTSPFAVVPKKNVDYEVDGRIIHDLSAPKGNSVNSHITGKKLDASTDAYTDLGLRALSCYQQFPGTPVLGMTADVDSAFQNVPTSAPGGLLLGGRVPGLMVLAIALTGLFGFADCPGLFGFFARAAKFYQSNGFSDIAGDIFKFYCWLWVDDFVLIEPDIGSRLFAAEHRLRSAFHLVFGSPGWNNEKFETWNTSMHAVGLDWDFAHGLVSMPITKVEKALGKVQDVLAGIGNGNVELTQWRSLVGSLRHVATCIPAARVFFQSFVSTEQALVRKAPIDWDPIRLDLTWFRTILTHLPFNGIPFESFCGISKYEEWIYLGWDRKSAFLVDFALGLSFVVPMASQHGAAWLLDWYVTTFKLVPGAFGPMTRQPTILRIICKTNDFARRLRNWCIGDYSLRQLGWWCTTQHVQLCTQGPGTNVDSLTFTRITNLLTISQGLAATVNVPSATPWNPELGHCNTNASDVAPRKLTVLNWVHGANFANLPVTTLKQCICNQQMYKTTLSAFSLPSAVLDLLVDLPLVTNPSLSGSVPSEITTNSVFLRNCQLDCVWKWLSLATNEIFRPSTSLGCPLLLNCYEQLENDYWPVVPLGRTCVGDVPFSNSLFWDDLVKFGEPPNHTQKTGNTLSGGETYPGATETKPSGRSTVEPNGSKWCLNNQREIGNGKERCYVISDLATQNCALSKPFSGYSLPGKNLACGTPIHSFLTQDVDQLHPEVLPKSLKKKRICWEWTNPEYPDIRCALEEQSSCLQRAVPMLC